MTLTVAADALFPRPARLSAALALAAVLASSGVVRTARADGSDRIAVAESLFQKGKVLMAAGNAAEACPVFEESFELAPSSGTMMNLARCHAVLGKTASAWAEYKEAATLAHAGGQSEREAAALEAAAELAPKVSYFRIDAPAPVPGLEVWRNGQPVGSAALGVAVAVDPGPQKIEAKAPGFKTWSTEIELGREADSKTVEVPALAPAPVIEKPDEPRRAPAKPRAGIKSVAAFVAGGVSVAALGAGAIFGGLALSARNQANPMCTNKRCTFEGYTLIEGADTRALASDIGFGVGVAAAAASAVLFLTSRGPAKEDARRAWIVPSFGFEGGGAALIGAF